MPRSLAAASIPLLFATNVWAANPSPMNLPPPVDARHTMSPLSPEPDAATLLIGSPAPMFSFIAADGRWHRSDELLGAGPVIAIFEPTEADLAEVQRLAPAFAELGVRPVAVLDLPTRGIASVTRKLSLTLPLVSDPMSAIADLYHSIDPGTGERVQAYFVIDGHATLRAMYYGPMPPAELLVATAARCLGRPLPPSLFSTSDEP